MKAMIRTRPSVTRIRLIGNDRLTTLKSFFVTLFLAAALAAVAAPKAQAFDHSHAAFTAVLKQHVSSGAVNYDRLKANRAGLDQYLGELAAVSRADFSNWNAVQQQVYLTNLYNAATLGLIIDNYPVKSIKKIGGLFSSPWKQKVVDLFGDKVHLDHVEHDILRKDYQEARLHFALVCAAQSCPPLRPEAYDAKRFSEQLDDQGRIFLANTSKNSVSKDGKTLTISKIFDWFEEDFQKQSGSVVAFVKPYLPKAARQRLAADPDVDYSRYDWSLNKQ